MWWRKETNHFFKTEIVAQGTIKKFRTLFEYYDLISRAYLYYFWKYLSHMWQTNHIMSKQHHGSWFRIAKNSGTLRTSEFWIRITQRSQWWVKDKRKGRANPYAWYLEKVEDPSDHLMWCVNLRCKMCYISRFQFSWSCLFAKNSMCGRLWEIIKVKSGRCF